MKVCQKFSISSVRSFTKTLYEDGSLRRKIVKEMEDFFKKTCVKWKTLEGVNVNERRQIEKELISKLKPLMPHIKSRKSIFKDIFKTYLKAGLKR